MVVGLCELTLHLRGARSLKDKRSAVRRVIDRVAARYPIAIVESERADDMRVARVGFAILGHDARGLGATIDKILDFIDTLSVGDISHVEREVFHWDGQFSHDGVMTMADAEALREKS